LDDEQFEPRLDEVLARAAAAGVHEILTVGVTVESSRRCVALAEQHPGVMAAVGIQPNYVGEAQPGDWDEIVKLAEQPSVRAMGETGLDRYWDHAPFPRQQEYFDRHLRLSQLRWSEKRNLPFVVHMRDCDADVLDMLREARRRGELHGVMISFTGERASMLECVELGLHISFAGMVTYKKSEALRSIAREVPDDRILIETDAPYLSPEPMRKQRPNEPALVVHTANCLAEARGVSLEQFAELTTKNAERFFQRGS
jgi:TatD DNase family protein